VWPTTMWASLDSLCPSVSDVLISTGHQGAMTGLFPQQNALPHHSLSSPGTCPFDLCLTY
jgi:hypothetical protein